MYIYIHILLTNSFNLFSLFLQYFNEYTNFYIQYKVKRIYIYILTYICHSVSMCAYQQ